MKTSNWNSVKTSFVAFSCGFNLVYSVHLLTNLVIKDNSFLSCLWFVTILFVAMFYLDIGRNKATYEFEIFGIKFFTNANILKENN